MAADGQMSSGLGSNLDILRQRAQKAAEFYQQQQEEEGKTLSSHTYSNEYLVSKQPVNKYNSSLTIGIHHSESDRSEEGVAGVNTPIPSSTSSPNNSFYRANSSAGIMDMRSSYNERNMAALRGRAFNASKTDSKSLTQTYAADSRQSSQQTKFRPPYHFNQQPAPQKPARTYTTNKTALYRSSSDLEVDSGERDAPPPAPAILHREYGSTSSLDMLGSSSDTFFSMLSEYRQQHAPDQRSPAPPRLKELLQGRLETLSEPQMQTMADSSKSGVRFVNGISVNDKDFSGDDIDSLKSNKIKSKHKERKQRAKSITGEGSASILKKLRGKIESDLASVRSEEKGIINDDSSSRTDEHSKRRAFVHFDCQSVGVDLNKVIGHRLRGGSFKVNTTTGASAASGQRTSFAPDKDDADLATETDEGDGKSNDLVLSCIFFRNELGGEEERTVSLTKATAQKHIDESHFTPVTNTAECRTLVRHPACCGVAILDSSPSPSGQILPPLVSHRGHVMEYVDHGAYYYRHFFYSHDHQNVFGMDDNLGPVAISVRREKLELEDRTNNLGVADYGTAQYRIICRTSELTTLRGSILEDAIPSRLSSSRGIPMKEVLEMAVPEVQLSCLRQAITGQKTCEQLLKLDEQGISNTYKVGIMYCKSGQSTEEEMYNNEIGAPAFDEFLNLISAKVRLKGFEKYRAGLDCKTDTTGTHSHYTTFNNNEIMFHVSTMLPYTPNNKQQLLRKRHIGNDIVTIIFQEPGALPFTPQTVRSQFQHVFIIVRVSNPNTDSTRYSIAVARSKDVPPFGPPIPENCSFKKTQEFVDFLLAKAINAENSAHKSDKFLTMATRTRQEYLKDLAANYTTNTPVDSGSKLGKFGLGSGRKKEKPKQRAIPDMFAKGALVWEVQVEDMGTASQVECLLAVAADTIVLVQQANKDVIFTIPCSTVIGWTPQPSSIRIYFGAGECLLLRPVSGEAEDMQEIITRLQAVTNGTETTKMALKRNGMGQLGFHIQSEGIVTDVEPYGFAWEAGLRKGSRLVEICKVATTTLSHDQIVDLLRTSAIVKVVVVPPMEDGSPRGFITLTTHLPHTSMMSLNTIMISQQMASYPGSGESVYSLRGDNNISVKPPPAVQTAKPPPYHQVAMPSNTSYEPTQRAARYVSTHHGYSDSTLFSGWSSEDGRGILFNQSHQDVADHFGSIPNSYDGLLSSGEELHSRSNSHDSTDYSMSGASTRSHSGQHYQIQPVLGRGERIMGSIDASLDGSVCSSASQGSGHRRQLINLDYISGVPVTGNISLELLKQSQNTKFLLSHGQSQQLHEPVRHSHEASNNPGSSTNLSQVSEGSSSGSSQYAHRSDGSRFNDVAQCRDIPLVGRTGKPLMKKGYTEPTASPRAIRRQITGMSSEESLSAGNRPCGHKLTRQVAKTDFQEELMRLIDPDLSENDLVGLSSRGERPHKANLFQRTLSEESLHNSKRGNNDGGRLHGNGITTQRQLCRTVEPVHDFLADEARHLWLAALLRKRNSVLKPPLPCGSSQMGKASEVNPEKKS